MKKLILLALIAFVGVSCNKTKQYTDSTFNYTVDYPSSWEQASQENIVIFKSPKPEGDSFQENINIMVQDLSSQPMDLEGYTDLSKGQIKDILNTKVDKETKLKIAGYDAVSVEYVMDYGKIPLKLKQFWFVNGDKAYLITYTATTGTFDEFVAKADALAASFTTN